MGQRELLLDAVERLSALVSDVCGIISGRCGPVSGSCAWTCTIYPSEREGEVDIKVLIVY